MIDIINLIVRVVNGVLYAINVKNKEDAIKDPANTLSDGGRVYESEQSFSDLSNPDEHDKVD